MTCSSVALVIIKLKGLCENSSPTPVKVLLNQLDSYQIPQVYSTKPYKRESHEQRLGTMFFEPDFVFARKNQGFRQPLNFKCKSFNELTPGQRDYQVPQVPKSWRGLDGNRLLS